MVVIIHYFKGMSHFILYYLNTSTKTIKSGYRSAHLIGDYYTTGLHQYIGTDTLNKGEAVEGYITFISPEYYPQTLGVGDILEFYEGSKLVGNIQIIEIYNELLKRTCE